MFSLPSWLTAPATILSVALFIVSAVISLYAPEVRRFLALPSHRWRNWRIEVTRRKLVLIMRLHQNTYSLLLFFIWNIVETAFWVAISATSLMFMFQIVTLTSKSPPQTQYPLWYSVWGIVLGRIVAVKSIIEGLYGYESTLNKLKAKLASLDAPDSVFAAISDAENRAQVELNK
jgi:hypothetical protein